MSCTLSMTPSYGWSWGVSKGQTTYRHSDSDDVCTAFTISAKLVWEPRSMQVCGWVWVCGCVREDEDKGEGWGMWRSGSRMRDRVRGRGIGWEDEGSGVRMRDWVWGWGIGCEDEGLSVRFKGEFDWSERSNVEEKIVIYNNIGILRFIKVYFHVSNN